MKKKLVIGLVSIALVICMAVSGTLAYLTSITEPITNVFVLGDDIEIELEEEDEDKEFEVTPGGEVEKKATVTAVSGSADMYVFLIITKGDNYDEYMDAYSLAEGWVTLDADKGIYYRAVSADDVKDEDLDFDVFEENKLKALTGFSEIPESKDVTLTLQAAAIQQATFADAEAAWAELETIVDEYNSGN